MTNTTTKRHWIPVSIATAVPSGGALTAGAIGASDNGGAENGGKGGGKGDKPDQKPGDDSTGSDNGK